MKMIIGGAYQGKLNYAVIQSGYARTEFLDGATCTKEAALNAKGIHHFHELLRRMLESGQDCMAFAEQLIRQNPDVIIISNELGYGIVPMEAFDRNYRETTGRVCTRLAQASETVVRVVCGIGTTIKHENKE